LSAALVWLVLAVVVACLAAVVRVIVRTNRNDDAVTRNGQIQPGGTAPYPTASTAVAPAPATGTTINIGHLVVNQHVTTNVTHVTLLGLPTSLLGALLSRVRGTDPAATRPSIWQGHPRQVLQASPAASPADLGVLPAEASRPVAHLDVEQLDVLLGDVVQVEQPQRAVVR
jgi:hypothetical protein